MSKNIIIFAGILGAIIGSFIVICDIVGYIQITNSIVSGKITMPTDGSIFFSVLLILGMGSIIAWLGGSTAYREFISKVQHHS